MKDEGQLGSCRVASLCRCSFWKANTQPVPRVVRAFFLSLSLFFFLIRAFKFPGRVPPWPEKKGGFVRARTQAKTLK